jgi:hypothetical protein
MVNFLIRNEVVTSNVTAYMNELTFFVSNTTMLDTFYLKGTVFHYKENIWEVAAACKGNSTNYRYTWNIR